MRRDDFTMPLDLGRELIIDNFAGGGGTSEGLEQAFGRPVDIAINHDPEALAMHAINHPLTHHLCESVWDVNPIKVTKNQPVGLVWLSPDCFPAGTLVLTRSGYRAIETVKVGDEVLTHRGRWRCVTETSSARRPLLSIRGHGHPGLRVSPEHPFYARAHQRDTADWVPASAVGKGMYWATPCVFPSAKVPAVPGRGMQINSSLLWLAGRYAGDGWSRVSEERAELVITCGAKEAEGLRQVLSTAWPRQGLRAAGNELAWHERNTRTAVQFSTNHRGLVLWLREHFGHRAECKAMPAWSLGMAPELRQALLSGYLSADGSRMATFFEATTVSKAMAFSVKALAASLGHTVGVYTGANSEVIEGRKVNARPYWRLRWRHKVEPGRSQTFRQAHLEWTPVRERSELGGIEAVFNIGVEGDESYVVEGIVVHNCKHFSKAKGGTPVAKHIRGLAWVGMRWVALTKPRVLMLENVEEFKDWGPLIQVEQQVTEEDSSTSIKLVWKPDPAKKGVTFQSFVKQLKGHGYKVEWLEKRACDDGAPTIRKRLFLIARRDGLPIQWPAATHADPESDVVRAGKLRPWRTAAECIDFSLPAQSIFDRSKPLVNNTQRRVAKGLWRHVLTSAKPFIVGVGGRMGQSPSRGMDQPVQTITSKADSCLATPILAPFLNEHANSSNQRTMPADEPLRTVCAQVKGGHFSVVSPQLVATEGGFTEQDVRFWQRVKEMEASVEAEQQAAQALIPLRGTSPGHMGGHSVEQPLSTVSAGGTHHGLAGAHLITIGYGERKGQDARTQSIEQPLNTAVAGGVKQAVVAAHLVDMGHGEGKDGTKRFSHGHRSIEQPLNTVTASGATSALAAVHLTHLTHHGDRSGYGADEPFKTITGANRGEQALVAACLEQANGGFYDGDGRAADAPMSTITAAGSNQRLVTAYCVKYYSSGGQDQSIAGPMHTLPTKGRMGLVEVVQVPTACLDPEHAKRAKQCADLLHEYLPENFPEAADMVLVFQQGQWWVLVDITLRMLKPRELFNAQGFPAHYIIHEIPDPEKLFVNGVQVADPLKVPRIPLSATAQVRMCGNSVSPYQAKALALANFRHETAIYGAAA